MEEYAIRVKQVDKQYKLYDKPVDRLKESLGLSKKKRYKEHYALHDVSFDVKKGETVGIIGTNGSGKSTILKIITGVLNPSKGEVEINGRISALLELGAGFNMEYTGIENVYLNGTMIGFSREEIDTKLQDILDFADIGEFVNQPVKTYSSGMFVRLAFAVAINIDPEILFVDEALSVGDVFFQAKCYKKFEEFKSLGKTILFVSHDLSSISKYCDKVVLLNKGVKMAEGKPKEIVDLYKKVLVHQEDTEFTGEEKTENAGGEDRQPWKDGLSLNPDADVYGSGRAVIEDFSIVNENGDITNIIDKGSKFTIKMRVCFHDTIEAPIFAFAIKNLKGTTITGTNSMYEKIDTGTGKPGQVYEIKYTQVMNLQRGEYLLSLGCTGYERGELTVYHRMYDICSMTVVSDKITDGFYDLNPVTELKKFS